MARATSSLPVPVAPVIRTELSVGAILLIMEKTFCIASDCPIRVVPLSSVARQSWTDQVSVALDEPLAAE